MPSNAIVSSQQSQVVAAASVTTGHTAVIQGLSLVPRLGQSQIIRASILVDDTITVLLDLTLFDAAFEEFDMFGAPQKKGKGVGV